MIGKLDKTTGLVGKLQWVLPKVTCKYTASLLGLTKNPDLKRKFNAAFWLFLTR